MGKLTYIKDNWESGFNIHPTEYTWQSFYMINAFRQACIMMIMKEWNVQTNEYDLKAIYSTKQFTHIIDFTVMVDTAYADLNKMVTTLQMECWNRCSRKKSHVCWFKCRWSLFSRVSVKNDEYWFGDGFDAKQDINHHLDQRCPSLLTHIWNSGIQHVN